MNNSLPSPEQVHAFSAQTNHDNPTLQIQRDLSQSDYAQFLSSVASDTTRSFSVMPSIAWEQLSIQAARIPMQCLKDGIVICDIRDFVQVYPAVINDAYIFKHEKLIALLAHVASNYNLVIYVPRGVKSTTPIDVQAMVNYTGSLRIEHIIIILEEGAHATVHDIASAKFAHYHAIRSIEVTVRDYAQLTFVSHQDRAKDVSEFSAFNFHLGNYSVLNYASLVTGSQYNTYSLDVIMHGQHAQADIRGVLLLDGDRTVDVTTLQHHVGAHNISNLRIKSAVRDCARSVYCGNVYIAEHAQGTHATQENKNILLSEQASAYSIPNLEALHNDVHCAHGTAVGQLDAEQLLYLQARGIAYTQAQRMLLQGFLADAIPDYLEQSMQERYNACISTWLDT